MTVYALGSADQIPDGQHRVFEVGGRSIVVYHRRGEYFAYFNYCPHQGAEICKGRVCGTTLPSDVYAYDFGREGEIVRCPWHGWEFDIKTGKSLVKPNMRLLRYEVILEDGKLGIKM
ncbi:Rieske (2Fe-2S) protein [Paenibacillus ginsengarvi]|uniref:Rieske (2Fe-2S) protein n=1 Tax=Paenibacillus ginsengarvi TaxID=400777 RepID=A0A3B0BFZ2_9BACL|nr:Rieske (2Fe-2S) protein [Paenibacillus ginsengarvi]RKN71219.1 Rieske (2Fe-2S) protein [Paenibacillus ginsengarvi]